jgi:hypothetical protein
VTFRVQAKPCPTRIYRKDSSLDLKALEDAAADPYMGFRSGSAAPDCHCGTRCRIEMERVRRRDANKSMHRSTSNVIGTPAFAYL